MKIFTFIFFYCFDHHQEILRFLIKQTGVAGFGCVASFDDVTHWMGYFTQILDSFI